MQQHLLAVVSQGFTHAADVIVVLRALCRIEVLRDRLQTV